jgi:signal transduction histidine kinase
VRTKFTFCNAAAVPTAPRVQEDPGARESELRALMTMASHDLKNPLASIAAHVEVLRAEYGELDDDFPHFLAAIERGLNRMSRLTQELMDYARADRELDPRPASLNDLVGEIVSDHAVVPGTARVTVADALPNVVADTGLLRHVLDNLIGNAIKYTPAGAVPEIEIRAFELAGGSTRVEVSDRGIGIPAAEQPRVFDAFHRCANSGGYSGTGLGLHICRRIIERHGGLIGVEPNIGGGSRFWFTLPSDRTAASDPAATGPQVRAEAPQ